MSFHDYRMSQLLDKEELPVNGLIMSAMKKANPADLLALQKAFPEISEELVARQASKDGRLKGE